METENTPHPADRTVKVLRLLVVAVCAAMLLIGAGILYAYASTPAVLRHPTQAHYHFRLQLLVDDHAVNFAADKFQTDFNKDNCSAALTKEPIHFHDGLDQFVHIHWNHLTGGMVLKQYGWNFIGGTGGILGYRFDQLPKISAIPIHGHALPTVPAGTHYYVYTGDKNGHVLRNWNDFLQQDLRDFFKGTPVEGGQLAKLNDVIGSVVIFAQKDPPTSGQIKDRFNHLIHLPKSACAG
ncbi:MAG TPA: hypothetical protein VMT30_05775 [Candidatus Saccharimonadia bacterium]|nr:hypothetical protein [Candidatus Saccharimonadia bacterium]